MSMKTFLMRKMLATQMKGEKSVLQTLQDLEHPQDAKGVLHRYGVPQAEQEKLFEMIENNPEFFEKIAQEVQEGLKGGKDQMAVTMEVIKRHETELKNLGTP